MSMRCRCCGAVLEQIVQPGYAPAGVPDRAYVTCPTPEDDCPLGRQTLAADGYADRDLTPYKAGWLARLVGKAVAS